MRHCFAILTAIALCGFTAAAAIAGPAQPAFLRRAPELDEPTDRAIYVTSPAELHEAARNVEPGGTITLAAGDYTLHRPIVIDKENVTLRSESGDRDAAVLLPANRFEIDLVHIQAAGVTVSDLSFRDCNRTAVFLDAERGATKTHIRNCIFHNIWRHGVKTPHLPRDKRERFSPADCVIEYCLFLNDRPKRHSDDPHDDQRHHDGNYIGGIDARHAVRWTIRHNAFIGIAGRSGTGRGGVILSDFSSACLVERNVFLNCDVAVSLGNRKLIHSPGQAVGCIVQGNLITRCGHGGIVVSHTRDCHVLNNTIHHPGGDRLIAIHRTHERLTVANNLLSGERMHTAGRGSITLRRNLGGKDLSNLFADAHEGDLRLVEPTAGIVDAGDIFTVVTDDFDGQPRHDRPDIGADEYSRELPRAWVDELAHQDGEAKWVHTMRKVHSRFDGRRGYVAQIGDSITHSSAFWSTLSLTDPEKFFTEPDDLPLRPAGRRWSEVIHGLDAKGAENGNNPGWHVGHLLRQVDHVLNRDKPEVAIIMVGTNDINGGKLSEQFGPSLEELVRKVRNTGCVPILNTIPPRRSREQVVDEVNAEVRRIARRYRVPLVDLHAEMLQRRPRDWDGTLISHDGIHPSGGDTANFHEANLRDSGYALRTWLNFQMYRQVYFRVLERDQFARHLELQQLGETVREAAVEVDSIKAPE